MGINNQSETEVIADIVKVEDLLTETVNIPPYQRAYKWSEKSISRLFFDIKDAMDNEKPEYRLGSIILHYNANESKLFIVDGQQRYISILLLLKCLNYDKRPKLTVKYELSRINIYKNYVMFNNLVKSLEDTDKEKYKNYLLNNCSVVKITVTKESLAFQMFDSQNTRGKSLKPHDLLKAYHLRKMANDNESEERIIKLAQEWEDIKEDSLADLFDLYLFQIKNWIKRRRDDYFNSDKIDIFKGIKPNRENDYNFVQYHINAKGFQLDQPIIAGASFFSNILYYNKLLKEVQNKIESKFCNIPNNGERLKNARRLLERINMLYCDRFGNNSINTSLPDNVFNAMFVWAYTPYMVLDAPVWLTYYKFAVGEHYIINNRPLFYEMCELQEPNDFMKLQFKDIDDRNTKKNNEKYRKIHDVYNSFFEGVTYA